MLQEPQNVDIHCFAYWPLFCNTANCWKSNAGFCLRIAIPNCLNYKILEINEAKLQGQAHHFSLHYKVTCKVGEK